MENHESTVSNLDNILKTLTDNSDNAVNNRVQLILKFRSPEYLTPFLSLFETFELNKDSKSLYTLFEITKLLILSNDFQLISRILNLFNLKKTVSIFEYSNLTLPTNNNFNKLTNYRDFLCKSKQQSPPIEYPNKTLDELINHTFTLTYFKDVIFSRFFDDPTFITVNIMISHNESIIVSSLLVNNWILKFLSLMKVNALNKTIQKQSFLFLKEFVKMVKKLPIEDKWNALDYLLGTPILLEIIELIVENYSPIENEWLWAIMFDILDFILIFRPAIFKCFIDFNLNSNFATEELKSSKINSKLRVIPRFIDILVSKNEKLDVGILFYITEILEKLFEPEIENNVSNFLDKFCIYEIHKIINALNIESYNDISIECRYQCCNILSFFIKNEIKCPSFKITQIFQMLTLIHKIIKNDVMRCKIIGVQFLRKIIALKDDEIIRYIIEKKIFLILIETHIKYCKQKENLLHTLIMELFDFIRKDNIQLLVSHVISLINESSSYLKEHFVFKNLMESDLKNKNVEAINANKTENSKKENSILEVNKKSTVFTEEDIYFSENYNDEIKGNVEDDILDNSTFLERKKSAKELEEVNLCGLSNRKFNKKPASLGIKFISKGVI